MPDLRCNHSYVNAALNFVRLEDTGQYTAEVKINCMHCGKKFVFDGLPVGLDLRGASVSPDGTEVRLACHPQGDTPPGAGGVQGFSIKVTPITESNNHG